MRRARSPASSCRASFRRSIASTATATHSMNIRGRAARASADAMATLSRSLFVTRYFWPELIGSAPFATDIAEWLARDGAQTTVLSGLPHYPSATVFPAYRDGKRRREAIGSVMVERLCAGAPRRPSALSRIVNEAEFLVR